MSIKEKDIPEVLFCDCGDDMVIIEESDSMVLFECPTCLKTKIVDKWDISDIEEEYGDIDEIKINKGEK